MYMYSNSLSLFSSRDKGVEVWSDSVSDVGVERLKGRVFTEVHHSELRANRLLCLQDGASLDEGHTDGTSWSVVETAVAYPGGCSGCSSTPLSPANLLAELRLRSLFGEKLPRL